MARRRRTAHDEDDDEDEDDRAMAEHAVVIAGGGPTGLMLAGELALAGIDAVIVERRTSQDLDGRRAGGLHARTLEVLDQRGVVERFVAEGQTHPFVMAFEGPVPIGDQPTRHNYVLALWQHHFERILAGWVLDELGVEIRRGTEVVGLDQDDQGVDVALADGTSLRTSWLVGCDGGRSIVRKTAGIDFAGWDPSTSWMIAEVEMDEEPPFGLRHDARGTHAIGRRGSDEPIGVVLTEATIDHVGEPDLEELRRALVSVYGTDYGLRRASRISRFTDMARQAVTYRHGRVLLAGDAAHVHPPQGGQGLNTGVQDAVNLGWKLALVIAGACDDALLDSYHAERHPVASRVLHNTGAQVALRTPGDRHQALRETMRELMGCDEPRRRVGAMIAGLDIHYDLGPGHPLLGRRMPDLDLRTDRGPARVATLLHDARAVLLRLDGPDAFDVSPWADRVRRIDASHDGAWSLPVLGEVPAPSAVLIRPDGHVAWTGALDDTTLPQALSRWCGRPGRA